MEGLETDVLQEIVIALLYFGKFVSISAFPEKYEIIHKSSLMLLGFTEMLQNPLDFQINRILMCQLYLR